MALGRAVARAVLALSLLLAAHKSRCTAKDLNDQAEELRAAINADYKPGLTNWDKAILNDTLSSLKLERIIWSSKPRRFEFTVFTQLTANRIPTLFNVCSLYTGPLSAAVYVPLVQPTLSNINAGKDSASSIDRGGLTAANWVQLAEAVRQLEGMHKRTEAAMGACQLDVMLFYEIFDSEQSKLLYPVNYLRNYARMQVRTRLLAMIDVDMYPSKTLSELMSKEGSIPQFEAHCAERRATILPAFEPTRPGAVGRELATKISKVSKAQLQAMHGRNKEAIQFKLRVFPRGHTPTDYMRWFSSSEPYQVSYKRFYEPWFITCDEVMPWYDIEFRGYGMNKIVLVASLNYYNYSFWVSPDVWLVHNPHLDTDVRKLVAREASDVNKHNAKLPENALYRKLTLLFGKAKRGMMRGTYSPAVDPRMMAVYDKVSWLRRPPQLVGKPTPESVFV